MGANSGIEWTHHTFNPWRGCSKVSPGCKHCYAEQTAKRNAAVLGEWGPGARRVIASEVYWRGPLAWDRAAAAAGERHRVFCASLADVFEARPDLVEPRRRLFDLIAITPHLDWLVLTKRPEFARMYLADLCDLDMSLNDPPLMPLPNLWLGVSVEDQQRAEERIPLLLDTPAAVRFLSMEPLLGPVDIGRWMPVDVGSFSGPGGALRITRVGGIDWVIVGGESGPSARSMDLAWARALVAQCQEARVPVFVKQLGARPVLWADDGAGRNYALADRKGGDPAEWPEDLRIREFPPAPALEVPPF